MSNQQNTTNPSAFAGAAKENSIQGARKANSIQSESPQARLSTAFNKTIAISKIMVFFFGAVCITVSAMAGFFAYKSYEAAQSRAYVVTDLGTLYASSNQRDDPKSRKIEVESHIRIFLDNMFSFDEGNFPDHIEKGLQLIGNDGKNIVRQYNEIALHDNLMKNNMVVNTYVDSVWVDVTAKPYRARVFARQEYENSVSREQYWLVADLNLRDVSRTRLNVHGLKIENWNVLKANKITQE